MITIKPHHFVDILTALGGGRTDFQAHPYGHAVHSVAQALLAHRDVVLCIELGADDICLPCCHNIDGQCDDTIDISFRPQAPRSKRAYNLLIDQRWSARLQLQQGDQLTARELCARIRDSCADISDIYRETPAPRTAERQGKLQRGVAKFLEQDKGD
jgi:hypothetical protein